MKSISKLFITFVKNVMRAAKLDKLVKCAEFRNLIKKTEPLKVVIGSSGVFQPGWIATDIDVLDVLKKNDWSRLFSKNSIDALLAEHVWEHLTQKEGDLAARFCFEYLKLGSYIRIAVPDGLHPDKDYIDLVRPGGTGAGADDHKVLYTYKILREIFESAGFQVKLLEYFDEEGNFHYEEWDENDGLICRSKRFDHRNNEGNLNFTSIIIDAVKVQKGNLND